ncbi:MAG: hypothetical protein FWC73_02605 [Defluviitaleaceae bacterium]|nr:hypothetical protein [Defluviitaleaceae bacterium]
MVKEIDDTTKEFYIETVEKYNTIKDIQTKRVIINKWALGVCVGAIVLSIINGRLSPGIQYMDVGELMRSLLAPAGGGIGLVYFLFKLVDSYAKKIGVEIRIDEIKAFFAHHGLVLEDEIAKGKSV